MTVWRDIWGHMPNVVVVSETPITEQGVVEDALLFVMDECGAVVSLTDERGAAYTATLPEAAPEGNFFEAGLDLTFVPLPTQQEKPQ